MNLLTCADVEGQIELYAAGECDRATASAIARHLTVCPACAGHFAEAKQVLGLVTLALREAEGLRKLTGELARQARRGPARPVFLVFVRRLAAVAALFAVIVGTLSWLRLAALPAPDGFQVAMVRPGAQWRQTAPDRLEVSGGEVEVKVLRAPGPARKELSVHTPAGVAKGSDADFVLNVRDGSVAVTVKRGQIEFSHPQGKELLQSGKSFEAPPKKSTTTEKKTTAPRAP